VEYEQILNAKGGAMKGKMVVISQDQPGNAATTEDALRNAGWTVETFNISKGEPLPCCLEHVKGVMILGSCLNVLEQSTYPCLQVYVER
jgi:hypothetical protein